MLTTCALPKFTKSTLFSSLSSLLNDESIIDMLLKCEDNSLDRFVEETERAMECFIRESVQQIQACYLKKTKRKIGNQGPLP